MAVARRRRYLPDAPIATQRSSWKCSVAALRWCLSAHGYPVNPDWLLAELLSRDLIVPKVGTRDKTGHDLAEFVNERFGRLGFVADALPDASFAWAAASVRSGPAILYGAHWGHWTAVRRKLPKLPVLELANPNPGYVGIHAMLPERAWPLLGPFSLTTIRRS